jgi:hypothetical protein
MPTRKQSGSVGGGDGGASTASAYKHCCFTCYGCGTPQPTGAKKEAAVSDLDSLWTIGMPMELAAEIRSLDPVQREAAIEGWHAAGVGGRQRMADFINAGNTEWTRRLRCRITIRRLIGVGAPWL